MRVLVTGATGFVGQHLLCLLSGSRCELFGTFLQPPAGAGLPERIKLVACDLRQADEIRRLVQDIRPQQVYHLAALSSVRNSFEDTKAVYEANFWGTWNLLEAIQERQSSARVLLVGSGQCYGAARRDGKAITETDAFLPDSPYAASKAAADLLGYQFFRSYGLQVIQVRPFNHTGPGQSSEFVCSDWARQVAEIELGLRPAVIRVGHVNVWRDFTDVRDVVRAYELLMQKGTPGEAYNVASNRAILLNALLKRLISFCSKPIRVSVRRERIRAGEVQKMYGSNRKLRRATGWKQQYPLSRTLRDLYAHWTRVLRAEHSGVRPAV